MNSEWSQRDARQPAFFSKLQHIQFDVEELKGLIGNSLPNYKNTTELDNSAALLSRLIARRASSFRNQQCFKFMRLTSVALGRWKELNIAETLTNIHDGISLYMIKDQYNIPTKVNFEYLLIRLQCAAQLLVRIITNAKAAFRILLGFIEKGFFVDIVTLYLGVLAHIWRISVELCRCTVNLYNAITLILKPHLFNKVKNRKEADQFPDHLEELLGDTWLENNVLTQMTSTSKKNTDLLSFDINDFNNVDMDYAIKQVQASQDNEKEIKVINEIKGKGRASRVQVVRMENRKPSIQINNNSNVKPNNTQENGDISRRASFVTSANVSNLDLGEALCRDTLQIKKTIEENKVQTIDINRIFTMKDLHNFIQSEETLRSSGKHKLSRILNNDQWKGFKLKTDNMIATMEPWLCVKKFKGLWRSMTGNVATK